jgi:hypothetical protein
VGAERTRVSAIRTLLSNGVERPVKGTRHHRESVRLAGGADPIRVSLDLADCISVIARAA